MSSQVDHFLPCFGWLRRYNGELLRSDAMAAVIVTIMLIPQSLAYALLAGLPPQVGLYASILPLVGYALFGSSNVLAVGPVAVVSLMTAAAVGQFAAVGTPEYLGAALVLALLSGLMLISLGLLRLGFLASLLSHPVISGFITASGILIAASQLKHIFGIEASGHTLLELAQSLVAHIGEANLPTLLIGGLATLFLFWVRAQLKPLLKRFGCSDRLADSFAKGGPVAAVIATILVVEFLSLDVAGVRVVGEIPKGLPPISIPGFDPELWRLLVPSAFLISIVGFVESVSVAQTLAAKRRERIQPNRELVGLGAANIVSAFSGGYPVTGGFARSVVNFDAGARTPLAGVLTAVGIGLTALLLTPLFHQLPKATLAATILVAVLSLVDLGAIKRTWVYSKKDFSAMLATILTVWFVGVEAGIIAGVSLSVVLFLARSARPHFARLGQVPGTHHFRNVKRHDVIASPSVLSLRIDESLYFANARWLEDKIYDMAVADPQVRHVVLNCAAVNEIDASALESLEALIERLEAAGVALHLAEVKGPVTDKLRRSESFCAHAGRLYLSHYDALSELDPATTRAADIGQRPNRSKAAMPLTLEQAQTLA
ncbi:sulfate permease [Pelagibius sp. Alg239-R121]|uniref:SulP family inorganic anion transporter n=1 Tax=Pelagibius sp. Alg239-R121 TaxID=2993448 RepID=UPI002AC33741|nr:sulfate permease [Pelagibius sp. Alg239-R121]